MTIAPAGTTFADWNGVSASGSALAYGQWHQVTVVEDACTQTHTWSVDGRPAATTAATVLAPQLGTIVFGQLAGTSPDTDQFYWDDVALQTVACPSTVAASTATVDYGDGSGAQPLTLNPEGTFNLSHLYGIAGVYTVTVEVTDGAGLTGTGTATVTVNNVRPTVTSISAPLAPTAVGTAITANATFTDPGIPYGDTHTAVRNWGDGTTSTGTVSEADGSVSGTHMYTTDGVYTVSVTVTDDNGGAGSLSAATYVVVYNPSAGFVTGGRWINSPAGAYVANPTLTGQANFGFVAKYQKGATTPSGNTEFQFQTGNLDFHSTAYEWLVISGTCKAQYKGTGTIQGSTDSYGFILTAIDGDLCAGPGPDAFRIKIWDNTTGGNMVYDNQLGAADPTDPTTAIAGGDIQIHP